MAACRPKLKNHPGVEFYLSRFAEGEWREVVRPWLEASAGTLSRSLLVVPTRGQAQALKQRCLAEGVSLLGVEFLTPGLARQKRGRPEPLGRPFQLLILRDRVEGRLAALGPDDPARGTWRSLGSDLEAALADFEDLLRGGFRAPDFERPELQVLFGELVAWADAHGFALGSLQDEADALTPPPPGTPPVADRLLILAGGPEGWPEFFGLVALARRTRALAVAVAEPEFRGRGGSAEEWVDAWQKVLGVEPTVVAGDDQAESGAAVAELWSGGAGSADRAGIIVGASRPDEMARVADELQRRLAGGATNIAVVFPRAGSAHGRLVALLEERGVPYADLIGTAGAPPVDTRIQRALVDFYDRGCRLEELLALWPLLRTLNLTTLSPGEARAACQRLFDEVQSHLLEPHLDRLAGAKDDASPEVARVARLLLPGWPAALPPAEALDRFERARDALGLSAPEGWAGLRGFAARAPEPLSARALLAAIRAFLPEKGPPRKAPGKSVFARVTLTTCRRAAGVAWSDCIFAEANAGVWPERREPSGWLGDESRRRLDQASGRFSLGLPTSEDRAALERRLYCAIARDTTGAVVFSAALFNEEDPEMRLDPNAWLERVMWSRGLLPDPAVGIGAFETLAAARLAAEPGPEHPSLPRWHAVWLGRRDPATPFDAYSLGDPSGASRPGKLSATQIQAGIRDPATLWFGAVLGLARVEWRPFARAPRKSSGSLVHRVLAAALRGPPAEGPFAEQPSAAAAAAKLEGELARLRAQWPADRYWDSFHLGVARAARVLLARVFELPAAGFCAVEERMPEGASVPVGRAGRIAVFGRMDLVLADRPRWPGATVQIVDFKTGREDGLSVQRMASGGASLQLGVYLEAARSLGSAGAVWMLRPEDPPTQIAMADLEGALTQLAQVGEHLASGLYGALTEDRTDYTHGFEWPLACAPVGEAILRAKFAATFPGLEPAEPGGDDDE
jgi:hypothetical protein